jgi:hypothetical protein
LTAKEETMSGILGFGDARNGLPKRRLGQSKAVIGRVHRCEPPIPPSGNDRDLWTNRSGWYYEIVEMAAIKGAGGEVIASVRIRLYIKDGDEWSKPIEGVGGSKIIMLAKGSLESNDEGFKMALTDALSVAMKQLGIASDVYWGLWDGTKYRESDMAFSPVTEEVSEQPSVPEGETKEEAPFVCPVDNAENYVSIVKVIKRITQEMFQIGMAIKRLRQNMTDSPSVK